MATKLPVCAVFGFGPGLGGAVARKWSREGFQVAILSRSLDKVQTAAASLTNTTGYECNVAEPQSIETAISSIERELGPIDTVIYNAGNGVWKTWNEIGWDQFDAAMKVNVHGLLKTTQQVAPGMIERGSGKILITGATASLRGKPFTAGFAPPKGAQRLLAQSLARDLGPKGVHVGYFIIDGGIGKAGSEDASKLNPDAIADTYWHVAQQPKSCWSFETEVRPSVETW